MAVIRDVMPAFELLQPTTVADAVTMLDRQRDAWVLAGGLDSFDWLKDRIKRPQHVVDLSGVSALKGIRANGDGLEIAKGYQLHPVRRLCGSVRVVQGNAVELESSGHSRRVLEKFSVLENEQQH